MPTLSVTTHGHNCLVNYKSDKIMRIIKLNKFDPLRLHPLCIAKFRHTINSDNGGSVSLKIFLFFKTIKIIVKSKNKTNLFILEKYETNNNFISENINCLSLLYLNFNCLKIVDITISNQVL